MVVKPRIIFDMDGTLCEWRNIKLNIGQYEDKNVVQQKLSELLLTDGYFRTLRPNENVVKLAELAFFSGLDVRVCTCYIMKDGHGPMEEKKEWLEHHMPWLPLSHVVFVPDGESKARYIPGGVREGDILVDDYTYNLRKFSQDSLGKGKCIKMYNGVNNTKESWDGSAFSTEASPSEMLEALHRVIEGDIVKFDAPKRKKYVAEISADTEIESLGLF